MTSLIEIETAIFNGKQSIAIVGLGYVGLPLACFLAEKFKIVGFDIDAKRVEELSKGFDRTLEVESKERLLNPNLQYTSDPASLEHASIVIVAVPTPINNFKKPDLKPVISASETVGRHIRPGTIVVFESTVYPGVTEDVCGKIISKESGLELNKDYWLGYSPERINPGDKVRTLDKIVKVVSGSTMEVGTLLGNMYSSVITAGIHLCPDIRTAEACKVIENTQRDMNIALVNELAMLFDRIGLDTLEVLKAAGTKWNFLGFKPGLVGGHCIGVDPYYLTYLSEGEGFHTQLIASARRINDGMGEFIAMKTLKLLLSSDQQASSPARVAIFGVSFKEDVPDVRNAKVMDIAKHLEACKIEVDFVDPVADSEDFKREFGKDIVACTDKKTYDAIIIATKHKQFVEMTTNAYMEKLQGPKVLVDIKGIVDNRQATDAGINYWRL